MYSGIDSKWLAMTPVLSESYTEYVTRLVRNLHLIKLGKGGNSTVFQHPRDPTVAVKVFNTYDEYFLEYFEWVRKNQRNVFAPKLKGKATVYTRKNSPGIGIVFMERLKPLTAAEEKRWTQLLISNIATKYLDGYDTLSSLDNEFDVRELATQTEVPKDVRDLFSLFLKNKSHLDLNRANAMLRGDQLVFTDPLA